ncbi:hypothetical protein [Enterococcus gilvus]|uniref:Uncharacterized protein n=1 Tax=Enterococcus gilvus ATCC BAA-350 TaxID=1158614 RepID=R2VGE2_9ENTE|nr:hypothetical protein [Enterococcus gilvus]EOI56860.1 hypothetical protein UKC_01045 [Enterococcus gilvus ATCC BAA-350]EOW83566.1 hypothetical protein I592_02925 [Enterococcus gilvus ATCC BAA-350]OJG42584.1 hypothetical protein RV02_GL003590 [Enterococcus gilvus]
MFDYIRYLKEEDSLSFEDSLDIYNSIFKVLDNQDDYLHELWEEVVNSALAYCKMRTDWNYFSKEEKQDKDKLRTSLHNTFIINLKAFYRRGEQMGLNGEWMEKLRLPEERKRWGDLAGYIVCFENIKAR